MKNLAVLKPLWIPVLVLTSLACSAAQRLLSPVTPTAPGTFSPTVSLPTATVTYTPLPSPTAAPTRTPRPTVEPIPCTDDSCLDACLERIDSALETHEFEQIGGNYAGKDANLNLVVYRVDKGELGKPTLLFVPDEFKPFQEDLETQLLVWDYASALLPPEQLKWISEYDIFTDGPQNILAWVNTRDIFDRARWQLAIDIVDSEDPTDVTYTLIHEFGHLITLNTDQIPYNTSYSTWSQNPATCAQFSMPEGCTNPNSYLNLFYQRFWTRMYDEWVETVGDVSVNSDAELEALVHAFYRGHREQFIREYAATNIREDIAESFMYFVLEPRPRDGSIASQKIKFFYTFPELVDMRKRMIQNICSYVQP